MSVRVASLKRRCIENPCLPKCLSILIFFYLENSLEVTNRPWYYKQKPATYGDRFRLKLLILSLRQLQVKIVPNQYFGLFAGLFPMGGFI